MNSSEAEDSEAEAQRAGGTHGCVHKEADEPEASAQAVTEEDLDVLLRRVAAMEELRRLLETNVVEALALEVSFMNTFGKLN